jgi:hypothetical protein
MAILATIIRIIHLFIIGFIILAPFSKLAPILILNITGAWCLLVHWAANNDVCFLTLMEAKLRGMKDYKQGFLHQFVAPVYNITDKTINQIAHIVVIASMLISIYNLLEHPSYEKARQCSKKGGSYIECLMILFEKDKKLIKR